ncbi:MFS transporter [Nesterenkonia rhizosphaerae]|uniref:MFS transporter n=1 Tax=Nesterenkonia rhizosphaerae TaxID=1348272 RepID=A0ABP9FNF6_9MICC
MSSEMNRPAEAGQHPEPAAAAALSPSSSSHSAPLQPQTLREAVGPTYFPIALIARFPYAMMVVGVLTLVVAARDSISLGGLTSAMVGLGTACFGPLIGAAADRWGQRPVVLAAGVANSLALLLLAWTAYSPLGSWSVLSAAFLIGASAPQVPPMSRSRLVGIITGQLPAARQQKTLNGTMAYESAVDEVAFVFGPLVVGLLAAAMGPAAPIIGAAVLTAIFVTSFALHRTSRAVPHHTEHDVAPAPTRALFSPGLLVVLVGVLGIGLVFGSTLTSLTSFMDDAGHAERAGLAYSAMGVGSAAFALGAALFPTGFSLRARWLTFAALILVGAVGMRIAAAAAEPQLLLLMVALLVIGIGIGPTLVTVFSLVAQRSPQGRSATAMSMATTGIVVGQSAASAITGALAENYGTAVAALVPLLAAGVILVAAVVNWFLSRSR